MGRRAAQVEGVYEREEGSGRWYVRYWQDGKKVRKSFGRNRAAAIAYLEKARTLKRTGEGVVPSTAKQPVLTAAEMRVAQYNVLLNDLCEGLLKQIQANPTDYKDQHNPPHRIDVIKKKFGNRPAAHIKAHEIHDWLSGLEVAPATQNRYKAVFSAIYNYGKQRDKVSVNPVRDVESRSVNNGVIRWLRPSEEARLRKVLQDDVDKCGPKNERLRRHMIHRICELNVALGTGMRKGEQYGLTWENVDFEAHEITIKDTKNGTSRIVHMIKSVEQAMRTLKRTPIERKRRSADRPNASAPNAVFSVGDNKNWWGRPYVVRRLKTSGGTTSGIRSAHASRREGPA
jgi:integrase